MPRHIVIVEDDVALRYAYTKLLEGQGYVVHQFADYRGVTELFDGGTGDLLITDIVLPTGTPHGIATAAMVQMHRPGIPVVFVTGYPDYVPHVPPDATVLIKPVTDDDLLATVAACLSGQWHRGNRSPRAGVA
jgi:DNA-binding NtrC family response regulator